MSNRLQMSLQRQHILLSYLKTLTFIHLLLSPVFSFPLYVLDQLQILMNARKISMTVKKVLPESKRKMCELTWPNITLSSF